MYYMSLNLIKNKCCKSRCPDFVIYQLQPLEFLLHFNCLPTFGPTFRHYISISHFLPSSISKHVIFKLTSTVKTVQCTLLGLVAWPKAAGACPQPQQSITTRSSSSCLQIDLTLCNFSRCHWVTWSPANKVTTRHQHEERGQVHPLALNLP